MRFENFLFKKIELWIFFLIIIFFLIGSISFAWLAKYSKQLEHYSPKLALTVNSIMDPVNIFFKTSHRLLTTGTSNPSIIKADFKPGFIIKNDVNIDGYFLISAYDNRFKENSIFLYRLSDQKLLKTWIPNINNIMSLVSNNYVKTPEDLPMNFRSQHPLLLPDGSIVISSGDGLLIKINKNSKIDWHIERKFHHSIENGLNPNTIITNIVVDDPVNLNSEIKIVLILESLQVRLRGMVKVILH